MFQYIGENADFPPLILPMIALIVWSLFMTLWMVVARVMLAVRYAQRGVETDAASPSATDKPALPDTVKWIGDNANHLLEQPILFYALCFAATLSGVDDGIFLIASWIYVVLRIVHSMWQSLVNAIAVRFILYIFFTLDLTYMAARFCFYLCVPGVDTV
ncbi:MAPEG family protein [Candidatus Kirkpatrickella diaphorinae]|uniref:MAPEG family protein n=1 Tax=Candidatus Kirkpatrickella diaphorinae TaxID=2984322 RepID=A0ABY6GH38_9PROT|nr:MAPEG family protein [Candidatus Kirkpatrickella diaphorinae]UYH50831.1 MAPEG family protein [Candidatus Kirkpatrickella diaphorinae]